MAFLLSKKVIVSTIIAFVIVAGGLWVSSKNAEKEESLQIASVTIPETTTEEGSKDSDNDGLKDWEEFIWGTDLNNPDTDGDGTSDGEEITLNRNPLKSGPDDSLTNAEAIERPRLEEEINFTDQLSREFFTWYLKLKSEGIDIESMEQSLVPEMTKRISEIDAFSDAFSESDIVAGANSPNTLRAYFNQLGFITTDEAQKNGIIEDELELFSRLAQLSYSTQNFEEFEQFKKYVIAHKSAYERLKILPVPEKFIKTHITFANSFNNISKISAAFYNFIGDPVLAVAATNQYIQESTKMANVLIEMRNQLKLEGIEITPEEDGYPLIQAVFNI